MHRRLSPEKLRVKVKAQNDLLAWTINRLDALLKERPDIMEHPHGAALSVMVHLGLTTAGQAVQHDHRYPYELAKKNRALAEAMGSPEALAAHAKEASDG